ncbi:hypothetical protein RJ639_042094 [Escallonia herrerae]|uniref:Uncharacterized protein n=1 Tax=Escallonia herrerae TaxID=1293975 RepID=A0AA88WD51_9ASTE|nr:hypothetical protein RJ639_042094 [Escallonia herrerae]
MPMACLNMFSNEQQGFCTAMGPRISFSNDFADTKQAIKHESSYREAPVSSDFEFSVSGFTPIAADELFSKGKLLPLKENCTKLTLRDELLNDDEYEDVLPRLPKNSGWWKEKLGLKRSHVTPKKADKSDVVPLERIDEVEKAVFVDQLDANITGEINGLLFDKAFNSC